MRKLAFIAEDVISVFKKRDAVLAKVEMLNAKTSKLQATFLDHMIGKCKAKEAPLFDAAFTAESQRILITLLLRFDRLRCLVQGATE